VAKLLIGFGCRLGCEWVGRGMGVLDWVVIVEGEGQFWCEFGVSHCNQWGLYCIVVQKCVKQSSCCLGSRAPNSKRSTHVMEHSPGPSVGRSAKCIVAKWLIGFGCHSEREWGQSRDGRTRWHSYRQRGKGRFGVNLGCPIVA